MKKHLLLSTAALLALLASATLSAQQLDQTLLASPAVNDATNPVPNNANWVRRHERFVEQAKSGDVDLLFLGDSITDFWRTTGKAVSDDTGNLHAANFGISGDRTQHLLWRIENGELDGIKPKVVVLMIGTNNTKQSGRQINSPPQVVEGIIANVKEIRAKLPSSKILLLAVFPRAEKGDSLRDQVNEINAGIAKLDDGKMIKYLDISPKFLEADGTLPRDVMPDLLHPNAKGYQIWADAMEPTLDEMMK